MNRDQIENLLERQAEDLCEHCDAVQILASIRNEDGSTTAISVGSGNWYARIGMAHGMVDRDRARDIGHQVAESIEDK